MEIVDKIESKLPSSSLIASPPTNRETAIYKKLNNYVASKVKMMPDIRFSIDPRWNHVSEMAEDCLINNRVLVWARHLEDPHSYLTHTEYGLWRAVHDFFGHIRTWRETEGRFGNFNFRGEIEALVIVAQEVRDLDVIEGIVLETVYRNLYEEVEVYPVATEATRRYAEIILSETFGNKSVSIYD